MKKGDSHFLLLSVLYIFLVRMYKLVYLFYVSGVEMCGPLIQSNARASSLGELRYAQISQLRYLIYFFPLIYQQYPACPSIGIHPIIHIFL